MRNVYEVLGLIFFASASFKRKLCDGIIGLLRKLEILAGNQHGSG